MDYARVRREKTSRRFQQCGLLYGDRNGKIAKPRSRRGARGEIVANRSRPSVAWETTRSRVLRSEISCFLSLSAGGRDRDDKTRF